MGYMDTTILCVYTVYIYIHIIVEISNKTSGHNGDVMGYNLDMTL